MEDHLHLMIDNNFGRHSSLYPVQSGGMIHARHIE